MSSAAVQSSGPALNSRQYQTSSSLGPEQYYAQQSPNLAASPASSRKPPSRRPSGSSPNTPTTPQQSSQQYAASGSSSTPRGQPLPGSAHASPMINTSLSHNSPTMLTTTTTTTTTYSPSAGPPIAPPPRTSSHNRSHTATAPAQQMDLPYRPQEGRPSSSRNTQQQMAYSEGADRAAAVTNAAQSRRRAQQSPREPHYEPDSSSSSARPSPGGSRSALASGPAASGATLPREESTILNRVITSDPQEDIIREQERQAEARPVPAGTDITPRTGLALVSSEGVDDGGRGAGRSRQDHSRSGRKETKFGEYILGQTLGEGEFGKVKMGWKKEGGVQVAIKLIRRDSLGSNPNRLPKIYREINILRELRHPNIVRLHEMVETERHIGIILEYASGGELFDYILNHRYLKDNAARRLFAQLVSGVGYLHKKGIVHRDLKLENLLLDRNRNIIITDFGFANQFDPNDELGEEIEANLANRDFVKNSGLEQQDSRGFRRGDLMQTSCGSPCYAAPELVVSDFLYTGRKVDVWSCGVILYAMLAGYLPFDDDPANPEGDNINLLYKYIVSTPLTFPEYVTPHARDLLKRILVPDPRKRADLFEVARHSWLSEYSHVVSFITSSTTTSSDIADVTVPSEDQEAPGLTRSASVREPSKPQTSTVSPVGGLQQKHGHIDQVDQNDRTRPQRPNRTTIQVEYRPREGQTTRGATSPNLATAGATAAAQAAAAKTSARTQGPVEVPRMDDFQPGTTRQQRATSSGQPTAYSAPTRPARDGPRSASDSTAFGAAPGSSVRPSTGGTMGPSSSQNRLPSRGNSYGQPAVATVATTNAQGRFAQPSAKPKNYVISNPMPQSETADYAMGRPSTQRLPASYQSAANSEASSHAQGRSHKRSNTVSGISEKIFGRRGSIFGGKQHAPPPSAMQAPMPNYSSGPRPSMDSSRGGRRLSGLNFWSNKASQPQYQQDMAPNTGYPPDKKSPYMGYDGYSQQPQQSVMGGGASLGGVPMQQVPSTQSYQQQAPEPRERSSNRESRRFTDFFRRKGRRS